MSIKVTVVFTSPTGRYAMGNSRSKIANNSYVYDDQGRNWIVKGCGNHPANNGMYRLALERMPSKVKA